MDAHHAFVIGLLQVVGVELFPIPSRAPRRILDHRGAVAVDVTSACLAAGADRRAPVVGLY